MSWPNPVKLTNEEVFKVGSTYGRHSLKSRIIKQKLLPYVCACCKNDGNWNGKKQVLQIEHKNGISNDSRLENLEFLCPNCHSQTESYAGKNSRGMRRPTQKPGYREAKAIKDLARWNVIKPTIEVKIGWKSKVAEKLGISAQKVTQWLTRVDPEWIMNTGQ